MVAVLKMRHKLTLIPETEYRERIKQKMIEYIEDRFLQGKTTTLKDIKDVFMKPPYNISEGSVSNYLDELIKKRKISTWKNGKTRYYGPPKIPAPIKYFLGITTASILISLLLDAFKMVGNPETHMVWILAFIIVLTQIPPCLLWYISEKRVI